MTKAKLKAQSIWPVWAYYGVFLFFGGFTGISPELMGKLIWIPIVLSFAIHSKNKKDFGKEYKKNPKPSKEVLERQKKLNFIPSDRQVVIFRIAALITLAVTLWAFGIFGLVMTIGGYYLAEGILHFANDDRRWSIIVSIIVGLGVLIVGVYFWWMSAMDIGEQMYVEAEADCDLLCSNSDLVDYDSYTYYYVEYDLGKKEFLCQCLAEDESVLFEQYIPSLLTK